TKPHTADRSVTATHHPLMKFVLLIPIPFLLAACATKPARVVNMGSRAVPGTTLPGAGVESVRYAENLKAYPLGRYIDPNNSRIMHEGHSIYRVETTTKWNLHPNAPVSVPLGPVRVRDAAKATSPVGNELLAELNQQKEATKAVMQGGQVVTQKLNELAGKLQQTQQIAAQSAQLKQEVDTA
ncbi:MAG: hypothetical protein ABI318_02915, partial [Chthoniobacteraceae bacterium]